MVRFVDPYAATNAFANTVQLLQGQRDARQMNTLRQRAMEQEDAINALRRDPNTTAEQFARAGDLGTANTLTQMDARQKEQRRQALMDIAPIAQRALQFQNDDEMKAYLGNTIPVFAESFQALGSDMNGLQGMLQQDGAKLRQQMQQVAAFGAQPQETGPLVAYIDPRTNQPVYGTRDQAMGQRPYDKPSPIMPMFSPVQTSGGIGAFDARTGQVTPTGVEPPPKPTQEDKPLPVGALRMVTDARQAISTGKGIDSALAGIDEQLESGRLNLGPVDNLTSRALNASGQSTENSRNYQLMMSTFAKMRNDSLRLNKGVQTEGDAQRAWEELFANLTDAKAVRSQLARIREINQRGIDLQNDLITETYQNYGKDVPGAQPSAGAQPAAPPAQEITATGPNGERIALRNGQWVRVQ